MLQLFEIKHRQDITWQDLPFIEPPVFALAHVMRKLQNPRDVWLDITNLHHFMAETVGVYQSLFNHDHIYNRLDHIFSSGTYFSVSRSGIPFAAVFHWQEDLAHHHQGSWVKKAVQPYLGYEQSIKTLLETIAHRWFSGQSRAQENIEESHFQSDAISHAANPFTAQGMNSGYALSSPEQLKYISPAVVQPASMPVDFSGIVDSTLTEVGVGNGSTPATNVTPLNAKLDRLLNMSSGLKIGSSGDAVLALQQELGFTGKALDGKFGGKTNSVLQDRISGLKEYGEIVELSHDTDVRAFLKTLGYFESGNTYNVINGGQEFSSYADHPRVKVSYKTNGVEWTSSAAGAYQFQPGTWDTYAAKYDLESFSPHNQDLAAIGLLKSQGAITQLKAGNVEEAIYKASKDWDAFPASFSGVSKWGGSRPLEPILKLYQVNLNENSNK